MTKRQGDRDGLAPVFDLVCRRFEEDIAEGKLCDEGREHLASCKPCAEMWSDMERVGSLIAEATGHLPVPSSFLDGVIDRADALEGRILMPPEQTTTAWRRAAPWIGSVAAAALLITAFWAGASQRAESARQLSPRLVKGDPQVAPGEETEAQPTAPMMTAAPRERLQLTPQPAPVAKAVERAPAPVVPAARPVPEPALDLPEELHQVILQRIRARDLCSTSGGRSVHVTLTVLPDGSLTNRQLLSSADAAASHHCVSAALDGLQLPPGGEAATVTLELSW